MMKMTTKSFRVSALCAVLLIEVVLISGCPKKEPTPGEPDIIVPFDSPQLPARGFFMGVLPTPAQGQSFDSAYAQAAHHSEFVPVWGRPTPFLILPPILAETGGRPLFSNSFAEIKCFR